MESRDTKPSDQSTIRHLVTFTLFRTKYAPTEQHTEIIEGDLSEWLNRFIQDPSITKVIVNFALYLW